MTNIFIKNEEYLKIKCPSTDISHKKSARIAWGASLCGESIRSVNDFRQKIAGAV